jgi:hypothetical protein
MKFLKYFLPLVLLVSACYQDNPKVRAARRVRNEVATNLKKTKNLRPIGSGGGMMDKIWVLSLSFNYYKEIDIEEGRKLLVDSVNEFSTTVNADEHIRPFLKEYPFGPNNIEVSIYLRNPDGSDPEGSKLQVINALEGTLKYKIYDQEKHLKTICEETFEEALKKISNGEKKSP